MLGFNIFLIFNVAHCVLLRVLASCVCFCFCFALAFAVASVVCFCWCVGCCVAVLRVLVILLMLFDVAFATCLQICLNNSLFTCLQICHYHNCCRCIAALDTIFAEQHEDLARVRPEKWQLHGLS